MCYILYSRIANNECVMNLKPQDLLFLLKLVSIKGAPWTFNELAIELGMSPSEVHAAAKRAIMARLAIKDEASTRPNIRNLTEFLLHGVQYAFFPERGGMSRGLPTAHAAPPLIQSVSGGSEPPPVWPDATGDVRGESFVPLYKSVPVAARKDSKLYELLALVDAIRGGRARERELAKQQIQKELEQYNAAS
jgi:hypothetical protein